MPYIALPPLLEKELPVPEDSQWSETAQRFIRDCGADCVKMVGSYYGKMVGWTVDQLAAETSLVQGDLGLAAYQLVMLASKHGLLLKTHDQTTLDQIRAEIDAGRPVICLIAYRFITGRWDKNDNKAFNDGHFIVCVGYTRGPTEDNMIINDPDYPVRYLNRGHNAIVPVRELQQALYGNNYGGQCVFAEENQNMSLNEQIQAQVAQIQASAQTLGNLIQQIPVPPVVIPPPPPTPAPGDTQAVVTTDGLQARVKASAAVASLGSLHKGDVLTVVDAPAEPGDLHAWCKITGATVSTFVGAYCAKNYLSFL